MITQKRNDNHWNKPEGMSDYEYGKMRAEWMMGPGSGEMEPLPLRTYMMLAVLIIIGVTCGHFIFGIN